MENIRRDSEVPMLAEDTDSDDDGSKGCGGLCAQDESDTAVDKLWNTNKVLFANVHARVNFIQYVNIRFSADSGFSDIPALWDAEKGVSIKRRCFSAIIAVIFVFYNTHFIVMDNVATLQSNITDTRDFYLVRHVIQQFQALSGAEFPPQVESVVHNNAKLLAVAELIGMLVLYKCVLVDVLVHFLPCMAPETCRASPEKRERAKWFADIRLFWSDLHAISIYSGMRLLNYVQPPVLSMDISHIMSMKPAHRGMAWFSFIIGRLFCLIVGFDFFLKKFRDADKTGVFSTYQDEPWSATQVLRSFMFMRQVMGVVQVDSLIRDRLFIFVFGGEESKMDRRELTIKAVWQALIARRIWRECKAQQSSTLAASLKYGAVMLTFSDEDFQHLILDPRKEG